jgi:hypothetical protein
MPAEAVENLQLSTWFFSEMEPYTSNSTREAIGIITEDFCIEQALFV